MTNQTELERLKAEMDAARQSARVAWDAAGEAAWWARWVAAREAAWAAEAAYEAREAWEAERVAVGE